MASGRLRRAGAVGCGARRAGAVPPAILAARTARMCGGRPPAAPLPTQPPNRLAADTAGAAPNLGVFYNAVACRCASRSLAPPAVLLKPGVGRSLNPSVVRPCGWRAARAGAWGPDRAAVAWGARERCVGRAPSVAWGAAGRTHYACRYRRAHARRLRWAPARRPAANPAAQQRSQQTPLARP